MKMTLPLPVMKKVMPIRWHKHLCLYNNCMPSIRTTNISGLNTSLLNDNGVLTTAHTNADQIIRRSVDEFSWDSTARELNLALLSRTCSICQTAKRKCIYSGNNSKCDRCDCIALPNEEARVVLISSIYFLTRTSESAY